DSDAVAAPVAIAKQLPRHQSSRVQGLVNISGEVQYPAQGDGALCGSAARLPQHVQIVFQGHHHIVCIALRGDAAGRVSPQRWFAVCPYVYIAVDTLAPYPGAVYPVPLRAVVADQVLGLETAGNIRPHCRLAQCPASLVEIAANHHVDGHGVEKVLLEAGVLLEDVEQCQALLTGEQIPRHVGAQTMARVVPGVAGGWQDQDKHANDGEAQGRRPAWKCRWHELSGSVIRVKGVWRQGHGIVAKDVWQKCDLPPGMEN